MSSVAVSSLQHLMVPLEALECPDYCFKVNIDFSKKPKDDASVYDLKRILVGLLNTSGGMIHIFSYGSMHVDDTTIDSWKRDLEGQLSVIISKDICMACVSITGNSTPLVMRVSKSPKLITLNSNFAFRQTAGNTLLHDNTEIHKRLSWATTKHGTIAPLSNVSSFPYGTQINLRENASVEFKFWKNVKNMSGYRSRLHVERVRRTLFSLPNLPTGGDLFLGVEEDMETNMNTVYGQVVREQDEKNLVDFLDQFLREDSRGVQRIWNVEGCAPERGKHWDINFIPVINSPGKERRRLIHIHFYHCTGGVFEYPPETYCISEEGLVLQMSFQTWKECLVRKCIYHQEHTTKYGPELKATQPPDCGSASNSDITRRQPYYLWSNNRSNWTENIVKSSVELEQNIASLTKQNGILEPTYPLNFTPSRDTILASCSYPTELQRALDDIEMKVCVEGKGFAIAVTRWLSNIQHTVQIAQPTNQVMDLFTMTSQGNGHMWCIVDPDFPSQSPAGAWTYILGCGRLTKRLLLLSDSNELRVRDSHCLDVQVQCYVYKLGIGIIKQVSAHLQTELSAKSEEDFSVTKKQLASILLQKKTYIKNTLGQEQGIHLTANQMEKILVSGFDRFNFVEGPPGSGKTYLALHLCTKYAVNRVGYVCTTIAFEAFLLYQGKCHAILVQSDNDLRRYIQSGRLAHFDCIIMDDVHNLTCSEDTWTALFKFILHNANIHLFIFADSRYQSFKSSSAMPSLKLLLQRFCDSINIPYQVKSLNVVHRNTQKVVSFIKACFDDDTNFPEHRRVACSHPDDGDDVEIRKMDNLYAEGSCNSLVEYISSITNASSVIGGDATSYQFCDVAILVDTVDAERDVCLFRRILKTNLTGIVVHAADVFPVKGLTVDILDNFLGLDRQVCVFVTSNDNIYDKRCSGRSISNPLYKAFVASRGISKVVFAVDTIDFPMALRWKLDKVSYKANKIGCLNFDEDVLKMAFAKINDQPALVYIKANAEPELSNGIHIVTLQLRPICPSMDITSLYKPILISSSRDYDMICVVHQVSAQDETCLWSIFKAVGMRLKHTHQLTGRPSAICWTPDNSILGSQNGDGRHTLCKYQLHGEVDWERDEKVTRLHGPRAMTTDSSGIIYVLDGDSRVKSLSPNGHYLQCITDNLTAGEQLNDPISISVETSDHWLVLTQKQDTKRVVAALGVDGKIIRCLVNPEESCFDACLYRMLYMAVSTDKGLRLYNIDGFH